MWDEHPDLSREHATELRSERGRTEAAAPAHRVRQTGHRGSSLRAGTARLLRDWAQRLDPPPADGRERPTCVA